MSFELGTAYEGTKAAADRPQRLLPRSKEKTRKGADGEFHTEYSPLYLMRFARAAQIQPSRFKDGSEVLSMRFVTAGPVDPGDGMAPQRFSVFDDIPQFLSDEQISAAVLADENIPTEEKENRIAGRIGAKGYNKKRVASLFAAISPRTLDDLEDLNIEGVEVAVAVRVRKWDGGSVNEIVRYFPASQATLGLATGEAGGTDEGV